ncbi:unnamed protein product, partial [Brassica oleracea var. botrytis]
TLLPDTRYEAPYSLSLSRRRRLSSPASPFVSFFAKYHRRLASHHVFTSFCRIFSAGSLYFIFVITISSTTAAAPLCISAVHAPLALTLLSSTLPPLSSPPSPMLPSSLPSPPPRSFSPLLSMLPEAPNLLSWRVSLPDLLPSPSQTTIAIGGASFILAIFCSAPVFFGPSRLHFVTISHAPP